MTPYLLAGVILVGLIGALNLILTFGVIRRLREHDRALAGHSAPDQGVRVGGAVRGFTAVTVDGDPLTRAHLTGRTAVGFFSTTCAPCLERLPEFVDHARAFPGGRDQVLVVVVTSRPEEAQDFVGRARSVARVVVERFDGPIAGAFGVTAFPTLALVEEGMIVAGGTTLEDLTAKTPA
ncbi:TlpA disulfide reductase family protein [Nonomuraea sp. MCN248]|uniref:TlpA disulfide reductase family protein n=1 Tax=Nonomuraea corallina TaxID=2989783 RepID=A0ABT4S3T0_9ACTN|nr:TlpA disulfide reductase family protein [Nonomuraea corallina]MDA0631857.1 TlpA disulfide reductase family protein [Nonomuraea corallina]